MVHQALNNEYAAARKIVYQIDELITYLFEQGNPAGVKCALQHLGVCADHVRLPLVPVNQDLRDRIGKKMELLGVEA